MDETKEYSEENTDQTITTEESTEQVEESSEDVSQLKAELAKFRDIAERRKAKLEELSKGSQDAQSSQKTDSKSEISTEEIVLLAQGLSEEQVAYLKKVASVEGMSLKEAKNSPIFTTWMKSEEERIKAEKASLGASQGSGSRKAQKSFKTSGLTKEENKELWKKQNGLA